MEPWIILDFKLPKKLDEITGDEIIGPKDGYKPLNYPLECSVNIKINKKNKEFKDVIESIFNTISWYPISNHFYHLKYI